MLGVFLKDRVRGFDDEREQENTDENVRDVAHEIEMVVRLGKLSGSGHERGDLERRIDADRTDHDHSEYDESENDEKNAVVDTLGLQAGHRKKRLVREGGAREGERRTNESLYDQERQHEKEGTEIQSGEAYRKPSGNEFVTRLHQSPEERYRNAVAEYGGPRKNDVDENEPSEKPKKNDGHERDLRKHGKKEKTKEI